MNNTTRAKTIPKMLELRSIPIHEHLRTLQQMSRDLSDLTGLRVIVEIDEAWESFGNRYVLRFGMGPLVEKISLADFFGTAELLRMCLIVATFTQHRAGRGSR